MVARAVELAGAFRRHGAPVVLVRLTAGTDGSDPGTDRSDPGTDRSDPGTDGSDAGTDRSDAAPGRTELPRPPGPLPAGWDAIVDDLAGHPGDVLVTKRTWSAFHGTDLDLRLRRRGVTQLVPAGIATSIGVESTARAAYDHGCTVTLVTDAMADRDAESHRHSVERILPLPGERASTAEVIDLLARTRTPRHTPRVTG